MGRNAEIFKGNTVFHVHLMGHSTDSGMPPKQLVETTRTLGIEAVVITDHNTTDGVAEVQEEAKAQGYNLRVGRGEEIKIGQRNRIDSEIELATFPLKETIPPGLTIYQTLREIQKQKAALVLVHPFDEVRHGAGAEIGEAIIRQAKELGITVAIEVFNARANERQNDKAFDFYKQMSQRHGLIVPVAGSDAHSALEVGRTSIYFTPWQTDEELVDSAKRSNLFLLDRESRDDSYAETLKSRGLLWANPKVLANRAAHRLGKQPVFYH